MSAEDFQVTRRAGDDGKGHKIPRLVSDSAQYKKTSNLCARLYVLGRLPDGHLKGTSAFRHNAINVIARLGMRTLTGEDVSLHIERAERIVASLEKRCS
ncbi:MAG: hypothetical protein KGI73_03550 [Patescibacteria group bacterium]|nr:hypothetical protein [Patescibacteria group bacterium]